MAGGEAEGQSLHGTWRGLQGCLPPHPPALCPSKGSILGEENAVRAAPAHSLCCLAVPGDQCWQHGVGGSDRPDGTAGSGGRNLPSGRRTGRHEGNTSFLNAEQTLCAIPRTPVPLPLSSWIPQPRAASRGSSCPGPWEHGGTPRLSTGLPTGTGTGPCQSRCQAQGWHPPGASCSTPGAWLDSRRLASFPALPGFGDL